MSRLPRPAAALRALTAATVGAVGVVVAALVLSGCGLPTMDAPAAITQAALPTRTAQSQAGGPVTPGAPAELFFVSRGQKLQAVRREHVSGTPEQLIDQTLQQLVAGPDDTELSAGLSTAIPPGLTLRLASLTDGSAVVDLMGTDPGPAADQAHLATGQVVLTLTALPMVDSVLLTRNGRRLEAALPDGELTALPLTERDFAVLVQH
ncbi:MAG: GerMN domain-containing protein [Actinomycetes bacterium]